MFSMKDIDKRLKAIYGKYDVYTVLSDWFEMMALAIANSCSFFEDEKYKQREELFKTVKSKYTENEFKAFTEAFAMLKEVASSCQENGFADWLGQLYMESGTQNKNTGQCFTPYSVAQMMAKTIINEEDLKKDIITYNDQAVGGGALPIAFCEELYRKGFNYCERALLTVGDIDRRCIHMVYVQLSLIGAVARVENKNGITQELFDYWDTPALCMQWAKFREYLV